VTFLDMCSELGLGIVVIPMVAILANVAIAKAFGKYWYIVAGLYVTLFWSSSHLRNQLYLFFGVFI